MKAIHFELECRYIGVFEIEVLKYINKNTQMIESRRHKTLENTHMSESKGRKAIGCYEEYDDNNKHLHDTDIWTTPAEVVLIRGERREVESSNFFLK